VSIKDKFWKTLRASCIILCTLTTTAVAIDWIQSNNRYVLINMRGTKPIPGIVYRTHLGSARYLYYSSSSGMLSVGYLRHKRHATGLEANIWKDWGCMPLYLDSKSIVFNLWNILAVQKNEDIFPSHVYRRSVYLRHWVACLLLGIWPTIVFIKGPIRMWFRVRSGRCRKCGYNLIGSYDIGRCPECGSEIQA